MKLPKKPLTNSLRPLKSSRDTSTNKRPTLDNTKKTEESNPKEKNRSVPSKPRPEKPKTDLENVRELNKDSERSTERNKRPGKKSTILKKRCTDLMLAENNSKCTMKNSEDSTIKPKKICMREKTSTTISTNLSNNKTSINTTLIILPTKKR